MRRWKLFVGGTLVVVASIAIWTLTRPPKTPIDRLVDAARRGDPDAVTQLLDQGVNPNSRDENDGLPLSAAAQSCNPEVVELLFRRGADPLQGDAHGGDAWESAMFSGDEGVIRAFMKHPRMKDNRELILRQLVGHATNEWNPRPADLDLALKLGFDPKVPRGDWISPLKSAVGSKDTWVAEKFLALGADPSDEDPCGVTPIFEAVQFGVDDNVSLLLQHGASPNATYHPPRRAAMDTLESKEVPVLEEDYAGVWCPLLVAGWYGKESTARILLDGGADPNLRNQNGMPLLVGFFTMPPLGGISEDARLRVLQLLLERGADPNLKDKQGRNALDVCPTTGQAHELLAKFRKPS